MSKEKEKPRKRYFVPAYFKDDKCYEAIVIEGRSLFLTWGEGDFEITEILELSEELEAHPVQPSSYPYTFGRVPSAEDVKTVGELYSRLYTLWSGYFFHPDHRVVEFLALFDLYSYAAVAGPGCIIIFLVGAKRTGKTTAQIIMDKTGYRAFSGVNPSEPAIYRTLGWEVEYAPMIILREYERASDDMKQIARESDILGATVPRVDKESDTHVVRHYHVYGPRICGANKLPNLTDSDTDRIHIIRTVRGKPREPRTGLYLKREVRALLDELRNDLLLWRVATSKSTSQSRAKR